MEHLAKNLSIDDILLATKGTLLKCSDKTSIINNVSTSSLEVDSGSIFIPIIGENKDGHDYMVDAYNNGCKNFLIDRNHDCKIDDINLIKVDNTTLALGDIAKYYKQKFNLYTIGVTGSVGKTSCKDIIYSVLKEEYKTLKNEGNLNNEIGLPKTIFRLDDSDRAAILEMGLSYKGDILHLVDIARVDIAVISNIGMSHIENFDNQEGIFKAKMEITNYFDKDNILIVNGDDLFLKTLKKKKLKFKLLTYGFSLDNDIVCKSYEILEDKIKFVVEYKDNLLNLEIPSIAKHNIYNAMAAFLVGDMLGISYEKIIKGLANFEITKGRLTTIKKKDLVIIDDSYNASKDSMISALEVLGLYKQRKVAILGDILETGSYGEELHKEVGRHILNNVDLLITVGKMALYIKDEAIKGGFDCNKVRSFNDYLEVIDNISNLLKKDDVVLIKASHGICLDKVVEYLNSKYED